MPTGPSPAVLLRDLIARVQALTGSDYRVDDAIHGALLPDDTWWRAICEGRRLVAAGEPDAIVEGPGIASRLSAHTWAHVTRVAPYTASLDAATSLVGRVLPGCAAGFQPGIGGVAFGLIIRVTDISTTLIARERAVAAPLAVLSALLTALLHQSEPDHAE